MDNLLKLKPLKLRKIEVKENPFSVGNDKYIRKLFDMLPTLKIVDHTDINGDEEETTNYKEEEENEEEEGNDFNEEEEPEDDDKSDDDDEGNAEESDEEDEK